MAKKPSKSLCVPVCSEPPLMLDIPHIAGVLCCTIWAVRTLIWEGRLNAVKVGHRWVVAREELQRFVAAQGEAA